jgi:hypothetical protein
MSSNRSSHSSRSSDAPIGVRFTGDGVQSKFGGRRTQRDREGAQGVESLSSRRYREIRPGGGRAVMTLDEVAVKMENGRLEKGKKRKVRA